jgi:hypothetical protein
VFKLVSSCWDLDRCALLQACPHTGHLQHVCKPAAKGQIL